MTKISPTVLSFLLQDSTGVDILPLLHLFSDTICPLDKNCSLLIL